jgi:hypothetical protein
MDDSTRDSLMGLLEVAAVAAVIIWIISFAVRSALKHRETASLSHLPPGKPPAPPLPVHPNGPGKFKVSGVDRETKLDTSWVCMADSEANARVKAELEGIIVTSIMRL